MRYNIKMYPYYYAATSFIAWFPIFFLYFSSILSLQDVLLLESLYYITVVILEVPTGYFSDRVGRRSTLLIGAIFLLMACVFYIIGYKFWILAIGQICFAVHMALVSGTNTVLHFESLKALGLEAEYGDREARVNQYSMLAGGTAALVGGAVAFIDLSYAYYATLVPASLALLIAYRFVEPEYEGLGDEVIHGVRQQLKLTVGYLRSPILKWIFGYYVVHFLLTHVPYEFYQPYIDILSERGLLFGWSVPIIAALIYAIARYLGALGARYSMQWSRQLGLKFYLLGSLLMIQLIILVMGLTLQSWIVIIVLFRSLPWAAIKAPIHAIITPSIKPAQRATFLSMMSLCSRLMFFLSLFILSQLVTDGGAIDWQQLRYLLHICAVAGGVMIIGVWVASMRVKIRSGYGV